MNAYNYKTAGARTIKFGDIMCYLEVFILEFIHTPFCCSKSIIYTFDLPDIFY